MTLNRRMRAWAVVVVVALMFTGCTPQISSAPTPTQPSGTPTAQASSPVPSPAPSAPPLGERYEIPGGPQPVDWGEPIASLTGKPLPAGTGTTAQDPEGWRVDLMGVYRLDPERVLVNLRLNADQAAKQHGLAVWTEPDYGWMWREKTHNTGDHETLFDEFSALKLTVDSDDNTYLPVRTPSSFCLCTMTNELYRGLGDFPVHVVMTTPAGAGTVTLSLDNVGDFEDVPVSQLPERTVTPLTGGYQLRLVTASVSSPGALRARFAIERAVAQEGIRDRGLSRLDGSSPWEGSGNAFGMFQNLMSVTASGTEGGWPANDAEDSCASCTELVEVREVGTAVDGEIDLPDPGGGQVLLAPTAGWLLTMPDLEAGRTRAAAGLVQYLTRFSSPGVVVTGGEVVNLDASVLFATDSATLSGKAEAVLDKAAEALLEQGGRSLRVVGHTDSTGSAAHNRDLSERRAQAVRDGLAERLGPGWTFTVEGRGESDLKVQESGLSGGDLTRARALNRRVEVSVE